jgi:D-serine deaminase-like pyridoxal phosphate-dependent protein
MEFFELDTPSLLIDEKILMQNIKFMQDYAINNHVALRPHTKTHKMPYIANLQIEAGAKGIAVAKTGEAEVMAESGISDIFIANEIVGPKKLQRISKLSKSIQISFGVDSIYQINEAEKIFSADDSIANILIEIEVGENRSGIIEENDFIQLLETINKCSHVNFKGLFSHDGNTYGSKDIEMCMSLSIGAQKRTLDFVRIAKEKGMHCDIVSYGSTPPFINNGPILEGITEIRPGTYALMDASQSNSIGTIENCAATVLATVISKPTSERVILDVGAKGLTMQERNVGICATQGKGTIVEFPKTYINKVFDEHAIINDSNLRSKVNIGDKLRIIPVHICPVCNLYNEAWLVKNDKVIKKIDISGKGKLQ